MRKVLVLSFALGALPVAAPAIDRFDPANIYFGAGLSRNSIGNHDDGTGFQTFAGYDLGLRATTPVRIGVEAGYMDTGDMDAKYAFGPFRPSYRANGLWATGLAVLPVNPTVDLLARLGLDFGDDDGLMFGLGAGFNVAKQVQLRAEFVQRDDVGSAQFNVIFRP